MCVLLAAPVFLGAQALTPPPQEYVLHFQPNSVAFTDQISIGATFTMEAWIYLDAASPFSLIMGKPNLSFIGFDSAGHKPMFTQSTDQPGNGRSISGQSDLPLYSWTHLAAVHDLVVMRLYVNGQRVASGASPWPPDGAAGPLGLGGAMLDGTSLCCSFFGALREARVWSRPLSAAELQANATQKLTGNEAGLIANWPLSEGSGQVARGIGSQAATLTMKGAATWANTQFLDKGPYFEIQDLPSLID